MIIEIPHPNQNQREEAVKNFGFNPCVNSEVRADWMRNRTGSIIESHFGQERSRYGWVIFEIDGAFHPINYRNLPSLRKAAEWH